MWRSFKDWPIQRKLTGMALFSTGLALLLVLVAFVVNDMLTLRNMIEARMTVLADVIGTNSTAALTFRDQKAAAETLAALKQAPHITFAEIYTADYAPLPDVWLYDFRLALGDGRYLHNDYDYAQGYWIHRPEELGG